ncbi:MAG: hypothetical protein QF831_03090 [Candidatus Thalassarchaeaceae archaeon]|jgi:hypothetical protein|nr:hypothetical protein [Candidatus Thalassarchaeaceae archaeon]
MMRVRCLLALFLALLVLIPLPQPQIAELENVPQMSDTNRQPSLSLAETHGATFTGDFLVNGTVWDDFIPTELHWQLEQDGDIIQEGSALDTMIENISWADSATRAWDFVIMVDTNNLNSCSCTLNVVVIDSEQQVSYVQILLFIDIDGSPLPSNLIITNPESGIDWRGNLNLSGAAVSAAGYQPILEWAVIQSNLARHVCVRGVLSEIWVGSNNDSDWKDYSISYSAKGNFNIQVESSNFDDGWWLFAVKAHDSGGNYSSIACVAIALHNQKPIAVLSGTTEINESESAHFDASNSDDPVWGKDGLRFTFIIKTEHDNSPPQVYDIGTERSWSWLANKSGIYDVMVLVTDTSGLSNSSNMTLIVHNIPPIASASIEGISFTTDETIRLPDEPFWTIDAGLSTDTDNDREGLDFIWFIDGEPVSLGERQILRRELLKDESRIHLLTLSATDDDGVSDYIEVFVGIEGTQSDPEWKEPESMTGNFVISLGGEVNMMLIFMIILIAISLITLRITRGDGESDIPKWIPNRKENEDSTEDIDDR